ncbi:MAG: nickel pincer cofactor biosynthesis protein LarB [bacterium]
MYDQKLKKLLRDVKNGKTTPAQAYEALKDLPFEDLVHSKLDHHRAIRKGFPEVVYCEDKSVKQVADIARALKRKKQNFLFTRASGEIFAAVAAVESSARYNPDGRVISAIYKRIPPPPRPVAVVTAGTSDIPVAEEAAETAAAMGSAVVKIYDVGVAGVHRLVSHAGTLRRAGVVVVVAGMEGALASVVGGLIDRPVVAVPTSVGYGASFAGISALLGMLNTCAPGVAVVNIDNGFGAGYFAAVLNREFGANSASWDPK